MKKTYINPTIYVRKVVANNILAGSPGVQTLSSTYDAETEEEGGETIVKMQSKSSWGSVWE